MTDAAKQASKTLNDMVFEHERERNPTLTREVWEARSLSKRVYRAAQALESTLLRRKSENERLTEIDKFRDYLAECSGELDSLTRPKRRQQGRER